MSLPLDRRDFLRLGAGAAAGLAVTPARAAAPVIRRNAAKLPLYAPDNMALAAGMLTIQNLPISNPLSLYFQANIHLTVDTPAAAYPNDPATQALAAQLWNNCPHGSYHFLPWHRLYVNFMERIIRRFSGYPGFAMPYWNYVTDDPADVKSRQMPAIFRSKTYQRWFNPLYISDNDPNLGQINGRDPTLNAGGAANLADVSVARAFSFINFTGVGSNDFGGHPPPATFLFGGLELTPHNTMHTAIGGPDGLMNNLFYAARDPIFFAHHSNIDRLWESWLQLGSGRANPVGDPIWLNRNWSFVDEFGTVVTRSAADALDTAGQLGYVYEDYQSAPAMMTAAEILAQNSFVIAPAQSGAPVTLDQGRIDLALVQQTRQGAGSPGILLQFLGVAADASPGTNWSIYLNLPDDAFADASGPYFAGTLSFLGVAGPAVHHGGGNLALDVSPCVQAQIALGIWPSNGVKLSLIENLPTDVSGLPVPARRPARVTIESIRLDQGAVPN